MNTQPTIRPRTARLAVAAVCFGLGGLVASSSALAQVTFFKAPPSADELRAALMGTSASGQPAPLEPARPSGVRTRGIVWQQSGGVPTAAPSPAAQSAQKSRFESVRGGGAAAGMPINFALGSARISPESQGFIRSVVDVLRSDPSIQLVIEGHTDATGSYERNMVLSWIARWASTGVGRELRDPTEPVDADGQGADRADARHLAGGWQQPAGAVPPERLGPVHAKGAPAPGQGSA
ncbi:MAG: OmpA family protein [Burkholderiaceae bacterium]